MKSLIFYLLIAVSCVQSKVPVNYIKSQNDLMNTNKWLNGFLPKKNQKTSLDPQVTSGDCITNEQMRGKCVKPSECEEEDDEDDGVDLDNLGVYRSKITCHYLEKCCPKNKIIARPTQTVPPPTQPTKVGCGWSKQAMHRFRSMSQNYADYGEFPWMVAVLRKSSDQWVQQDYLEGGTLIHPSVVMTVAYNIRDVTKDDVKCRAGEWDTQTTKELYPHQERDVSKIIRHEGFLSKKGHNNIALLILEKPFDLLSSPQIGIACLGPQMPAEGTECFGMGWGQKEFNKKDEYAVVLKKVALPIYNRAQCQTNLRPKLGLKWKLHMSMMCAGGVEGFDTCKGDGGSSLACPISDDPDEARYAVYGMVSFGVGCGDKDIPGVYTNIPFEYDWIKYTMAIENLDSSSFMY